MRSEDELRAAFAAKAADAPRAEDVLRAVVRAEQSARPRGRRTWVRWLVPAVTAAAAAAIAVPLVLSGNGSGREQAGSGSVATGSSEAAAGGASAAPQAPSARAASVVCRPDQVRAAISVHGRDATLDLTAGSTSCAVARVPIVRWQAPPGQLPGSARGGANAPEAERPASSYGTLRQGTTASAPIGWGGACGASPRGTVLVDWGAGPVTVQLSGRPSVACPGPPAGAPHVGPFTGLS